MKRTIALTLALAGFWLASHSAVHAQGLKELNFGIISTESTSNLKSIWLPFLTDMEKYTGIKINAYFAPDYAGVIEGMRFDKVQLGWFGNKSALEAVDRANGEIFVQTVDKDGNPGYWSLLITHKDSPLNNLEDVLKNPGKYTFGNGDPNSTSGFLVPSYYVFTQNKIDPKKHFTRLVSANHETNAVAVSNKQVDLATNNTENMSRFEKTHPDKRGQIKIIWKSPLIPSDPIVWRKDLPPETKAKLKAFFLDYGRKGSDVERELGVLTALQWKPFKESDNNQLLPIRQLELFKERGKLQADERLSPGEKAAKLEVIDLKLSELNAAMAKLAASK